VVPASLPGGLLCGGEISLAHPVGLIGNVAQGWRWPGLTADATVEFEAHLFEYGWRFLLRLSFAERVVISEVGQ